MSRRLSLLLVFLLSLSFLECANPFWPFNKEPRELTPAERSLVQSDNRFGLRLLRKIIEEDQGKNAFISPLSVAMALGMTYNGAAGSTQEAMQSTLELGGLTIEEVNESYQGLMEILTGLDSKVQFRIANSIWYREDWSFEEEFINLCKAYFHARVSGLDFSGSNAPDVINGWVEENTNGKIEEIVETIDPFTVMFLINAIYFKGTWAYEFDQSLTQDDWFTSPGGSQTPCKMMKQEGEFRYLANSDFQAIDLPYGDGYFSMTIFLPRPEGNIDYLIGEFTEENWNEWVNSFSKQEGTLQLPRFTCEYETKLNDILKALGMGIAFRPDSADFAKMYAGPLPLYISEVKHKTFVEVNEKGTEAAAATSVEMGYMYGPAGFSMRVDRPFLFVIRENHSRAILFVGEIVQPTSE